MPVDPALQCGKNILLQRLSLADQRLLAPYREQVTLDFRRRVWEPGEDMKAFYFPESVVLSIEEQIGDNEVVETAVVGREGMLGWPALLGLKKTAHRATVQLRTGSAVRIATENLRNACLQSPTLNSVLLGFVETISVQMGSSIASHLKDALGIRVARWLLMRHDRVAGDILFVQHEEIARNLNTRRASITEALQMLEGDQLLRCRRGKITIRDRHGLEARTGAAYGSSEAHYRTMIAPFGKSRAASYEC